MPIKAQAIWDAIADTVKDVSDQSNATQLRGLNYVVPLFYDKVRTINAGRLIETEDISAVAGQRSYTLPTDFRTIDADSCGLFIAQDGNLAQELPYLYAGANNFGYYIESNQIKLTADLTSTLQFRYIPEITEITALEDDLPDCFNFRHVEFLKDALLVWYEKNDQNTSGEVAADQRFIRALNLFGNTISQAPLVGSIGHGSAPY